jgi:uncharacterized protein YndB with AHSA1/START domain
MSNPVTIDAPEGTPFVEMTREFDQPVEKLFRAHAERELVQRWLGPRDAGTVVEAWDARPGGRYRYFSVDGDGTEYVFVGWFHSVTPNESLIQTFEFEMFPGAVGIDSYFFESLEGDRSRLTVRSVYPTVEARDGAVASGMEYGVVEGYERCDEVLESL